MKTSSQNYSNYNEFINLLSELVVKAKTLENKKQSEGGNKNADYKK